MCPTGGASDRASHWGPQGRDMPRTSGVGVEPYLLQVPESAWRMGSGFSVSSHAGAGNRDCVVSHCVH